MQRERFGVLVLLAGGLISVREAEEALYPSPLAGLLRHVKIALCWGVICTVVLLIVAGTVAEGSNWNPWVGAHYGLLSWNGPMIARHVHAILRTLFGGL